MKNQYKNGINWGIIGVGDVCEVKSAPAMNLIEGSKLVAVMRRNAEKAADFATPFIRSKRQRRVSLYMSKNQWHVPIMSA
jgi:hypothetical protein